MRHPLLSAIILTVTVLTGCSVLEDRDLAPGDVVVDLHTFSPLEEEDYIFCLRHGNSDEKWIRIPKGGGTEPIHVDGITRNNFRWFLYPASLERSASLVGFPAGDPRRLYMAAGNVDATPEQAYLTPKAQSQAAQLTVVFSGDGAPAPGTPMTAGLTTGRTRVDLDTWEAFPAESETTVTQTTSDGTFRFLVYRQADYLQTLRISGCPGVPSVIDVGLALRRCNYDWMAENLPDITLTIDITTNSFSIRVEPWDEGDSKDITYL